MSGILFIHEKHRLNRKVGLIMVAWNVYYHEFNANKIKTYNIFQNGKFVEYIKKHKKRYDTKNDFAKAIRRELFYYFGSKCEWEMIITSKDGRIILTPWIGRREDVSMDVTNDKTFDWSGFYNWLSQKFHVDKDGSIKFDAYSQVMYRFDEFIDYCWTVKRWILPK